jgi:chromosome segregation ATPase
MRGLAAYAAAARETTVRQLRDAMKLIEDEIANPDGIYPHGTLTQSELCRRANVKPSALQKKTHKATTLVEVNEWLARIARAFRTKKTANRNMTAKLDELREQNRLLMQQFHENELDLNEARNEIRALKARIAVLGG